MLGDAGGSLTSTASSMPHLDQHSALPPESIMGCDNTPRFRLFISYRVMWLLLEAAGGGDDSDYDAAADREPFKEIHCIQYFLITK